ncbi:MAG: methyltransferase domain-containing protein [Lentisphaerae bacterium]|nr:methyltransferase domain-containing protein [Lentisphaerota bacterium]
MDAAVFDKFRQIVYEKSGISLKPGKEALVSARVAKRMRALGIPDHRSYLRFVTEDESQQEFIHLIDAISTNVTSFFREAAHFDYLTTLLQGWLAGGQRRFRFWSAASSSGEEPYSMAITVLESAGRHNADIRILATDISTQILVKCTEGVYSREKVEPVPSMLRKRYFDQVRENAEVSYRVKAPLKNITVFRRLNLAEPPFPMKGPMDAIFCRNVMIYFDNRVRTKLLTEAFRLLKPGGHLFVGHAESLTGLVSPFKSVSPSVYIKPS